MSIKTFQLNTTINTKATNLDEVNNELSRLKCVIGLLLAKMAPQQRDQFINDLKALGLDEEANTYAAFNPKN
ncbi:hypothetical protein Q2Q12_002970 [Escherichia coli]|nr:hypothetical protein [Escherichia coli]ELM8043095.1 hypothetical protein [Escherichia coli]